MCYSVLMLKPKTKEIFFHFLAKELFVILALLISASFALWAGASSEVSFRQVILPLDGGGEGQGGGGNGFVAPPSTSPETPPAVSVPKTDQPVTDKPKEAVPAPVVPKVDPKDFRAIILERPTGLSFYRGEERKLSVLIRNTGKATWNVDRHPIHIGVVGDKPSRFLMPSWISPDRPRISYSTATNTPLLTNEIGPNRRLRLSFTAKAPLEPGTFTEQWALVVDGVTWIPSTEFRFRMRVLPPVKAQSIKPLTTPKIQLPAKPIMPKALPAPALDATVKEQRGFGTAVASTWGVFKGWITNLFGQNAMAQTNR